MRILRRLLHFIAVRLLGVTLVFALLILSFYTAMNTANIWVLMDEGLQMRAGAVLTGKNADRLSSYFREDFLSADPVLQVGLSDRSPYRDYTIRSFRHDVQILSIWSWPWEKTARAEVVERVPSIDGTIRSSSRAQALKEGGEERLNPPAWNGGRYRVSLVREKGRWKISNLQLLEALKEAPNGS